MKTKALVIVTSLLLATSGLVGLAEKAGATPKESQRLRGLGGRTFAVHVTNLGTGEEFANCYVFEEDGTWIDPPFPVPGTWVQHKNGASTTYTAEAYFEFLPVVSVLLIQEGKVTPAGGKGVLQLEATTRVTGFFVDEQGQEVEIDDTFLSVGMQDNTCLD